MNEIPPIQSAGNIPVSPFSRSPASAVAVSDGGTAVDRLELSDVAQILARLPENTSIRAEKVAAVREQVLEGTYETDDKLEHVLDRLMNVLGLR